MFQNRTMGVATTMFLQATMLTVVFASHDSNPIVVPPAKILHSGGQTICRSVWRRLESCRVRAVPPPPPRAQHGRQAPERRQRRGRDARHGLRRLECLITHHTFSPAMLR